MAKDHFQTRKPHVSRASAKVRNRLRSQGVSGLGIQQLELGQPLSNPHDRQIVAAIVMAVLELAAPDSQVASAVQIALTAAPLKNSGGSY